MHARKLRLVRRSLLHPVVFPRSWSPVGFAGRESARHPPSAKPIIVPNSVPSRKKSRKSAAFAAGLMKYSSFQPRAAALPLPPPVRRDETRAQGHPLQQADLQADLCDPRSARGSAECASARAVGNRELLSWRVTFTPFCQKERNEDPGGCETARCEQYREALITSEHHLAAVRRRIGSSFPNCGFMNERLQ